MHEPVFKSLVFCLMLVFSCILLVVTILLLIDEDPYR